MPRDPAAPTSETPPSEGLVRCTGPDCHRWIRWVTTLAGKRLPLDPDPTPTGVVVLRHVHGLARAKVLTGAELPAQETAWTPHWATCPNADQYRAKKARTAKRCTVCKDVLDPVLIEEQELTHPSCDPEHARDRAGAR